MSESDEHGYACEDCEGTGQKYDSDTNQRYECPECYSGIIGADADDCEVNRCDACKNPRVLDDPTVMFR